MEVKRVCRVRLRIAELGKRDKNNGTANEPIITLYCLGRGYKEERIELKLSLLLEKR